MIPIPIHLHGSIYSLKQGFAINAGKDKDTLVKSLGTLRTGTDAYSRERMPHRSEETALLRQGTAVTHNGIGVHLQAVVVVETERFMLNHTSVKCKAA